MAPIANVFYHVIPILLTFTSVLLSLITLLAPTPILPTQVSFLFLKPLPADAKTGVASLTTRFFDEDLSIPGRLLKNEQRMLMARSDKPSSSDSAPEGLWIGMLGSCSRPGSGTLNCTSPDMMPTFAESYERIGLSANEQAVLPAELPMYPSSLVTSIVFGSLSLFMLIAASLPYHLAGKNNQLLYFFFQHHRHIAKLACLAGIVSLAVGIILTVSLRITLGNAAVAFNVIDGSSGLQANLGSAFNQLWASWIILGIGCLVAICLCGRENTAFSTLQG